MGKCSWWEGHGLLGPLSSLPTLTFQSQLLPGVIAHLDGVRLKTQGWGDTGIGELGAGGGGLRAQSRVSPGRGREGSVTMGEMWRGHKERHSFPPSSPPNKQGSSAILKTWSRTVNGSSPAPRFWKAPP